MNEAIVRKTPQARIDLIGCYVYIGERNRDAAGRFRLTAEASIAKLGRTPGTGEAYPTTNPRLEGMRCAGVTRFKNFRIFYRPVAGRDRGPSVSYTRDEISR